MNAGQALNEAIRADGFSRVPDRAFRPGLCARNDDHKPHPMTGGWPSTHPWLVYHCPGVGALGANPFTGESLAAS